jgi:hypothetical protein
MSDIAAEIKERELKKFLEALRDLKVWIDVALNDEASLTDEAFGAIITFTLDHNLLSADELVVIADASKSQISRWRNGESLPSDRHKKQGVMRDLQAAVEKRLQERTPRHKRARRRTK